MLADFFRLTCYSDQCYSEKNIVVFMDDNNIQTTMFHYFQPKWRKVKIWPNGSKIAKVLDLMARILFRPMSYFDQWVISTLKLFRPYLTLISVSICSTHTCGVCIVTCSGGGGTTGHNKHVSELHRVQEVTRWPNVWQVAKISEENIFWKCSDFHKKLPVT